jgi:hypothetical protein
MQDGNIDNWKKRIRSTGSHHDACRVPLEGGTAVRSCTGTETDVPVFAGVSISVLLEFVGGLTSAALSFTEESSCE